MEHYKRRWYYGLWLFLLGLSLIALALWETPAQSGTAEVRLILEIRDLPPQCEVTTWTGPNKNAQAMNHFGITQSQNRIVDQTFRLPVAYRRWLHILIPRKTADLIVIRFTPPRGTPRYLPIPLESDWTLGVLKPSRKMTLKMSIEWDMLSENLKQAIAITRQEEAH